MELLVLITAGLRIIQTNCLIAGKNSFLTRGPRLCCESTKLWAPKLLKIGADVYIGKQIHIAANCEIGDYRLIASRVSIIGRHDHDFSAVGFPMRFAPWIGSKRFPSPYIDEKAVIESDVWLGHV